MISTVFLLDSSSFLPECVQQADPDFKLSPMAPHTRGHFCEAVQKTRSVFGGDRPIPLSAESTTLSPAVRKLVHSAQSDKMPPVSGGPVKWTKSFWIKLAPMGAG
jgi:hypothetical protein